MLMAKLYESNRNENVAQVQISAKKEFREVVTFCEFALHI